MIGGGRKGIAGINEKFLAREKKKKKWRAMGKARRRKKCFGGLVGLWFLRVLAANDEFKVVVAYPHVVLYCFLFLFLQREENE